MRTDFYLGFVLCLFLFLPVQAEVYKWTDESGQVHYSDTPPSEETPGYQLRPSGSAGNTSSLESLTDTERRARQKKLSDSLEADRRDKEQAEAKRKDQQAKREHNCMVARKQLNATKKYNKIFEYDQQGNRVYYDDAKKQQYLESKRAEVRKWCE